MIKKRIRGKCDSEVTDGGNLTADIHTY